MASPVSLTRQSSVGSPPSPASVRQRTKAGKLANLIRQTLMHHTESLSKSNHLTQANRSSLSNWIESNAQLLPTVESQNPSSKFVCKSHQQPCSCAENLTLLEQDIHQLETRLRQIEQQKRIMLHEKVEVGLRYLDAQAQRINTLSACLEAEIHHFQEVAQSVDQNYQRLKPKPDPTPPATGKAGNVRSLPAHIWSIQPTSVPTVVKRGLQYIFSNRVVKPTHPSTATNSASAKAPFDSSRQYTKQSRLPLNAP